MVTLSVADLQRGESVVLPDGSLLRRNSFTGSFRITGASSGGTDESAKSVHVVSALNELDLIRRRLSKGRTLAGWQPEHIPADVFDGLLVDGDVGRARSLVKAAGHRQRRDAACADAQRSVVDGLHALTADLAAGRISTAAFVDEGVRVVGAGIRAGLDLGATHARTPTAVKSDDPAWVDGLDGRFGLYAGSVPQAYEQGYGLATLGAADDPDNIVVRWHARPGACELCEPRNGTLFTVGRLPGWPGDGGFGRYATVCRGGKQCRCNLEYVTVTPDEAAAVAATPNPGPQPATPAAAERQAEARAEITAHVTAAREALAAADPSEALAELLDAVAEAKAEEQRPYLTGLLQDVLADATRNATPTPPAARRQDRDGGFPVAGAVITAAVAAAIAGQVASQDQAAPATAPPAVEQQDAVTKGKTGKVYRYLARHYPESVLGWVRDAHWSGPTEVKLADVDMGRRPGGARDPAKVRAIAAAVEAGEKLDPVVLVKTPAGLPYQVADGFHRTLGLAHAGRGTVEAWVGEVDSETGPWDREMHRRKLNKADEGAVGDHKARHLIRWFNEGADGQIPWGAPGDYDACVRVASEHVPVHEVHGFCANRHFDALGVWPATHAAAGRHATRKAFNPAEPRDPHSGKWTDGPGAIVEKLIKVGSSTIRVEFHPGEEVTLHDDANGRSTRFTRKGLVTYGRDRFGSKSLWGAIFASVNLAPGERNSHYSDWGIEKIANAPEDPEDDTWHLDTIALHLGLRDGGDVGPGKQNLFSGPGLQMTIGDAADLIGERVDPLISRIGRTSTGHGHVDLFPDGREIVIRPTGDGAPTWRLPIKDYRALSTALDAVYDFDEAADGVLTQERDVTTTLGTFTVRAWRDADNKVTKLSIQPHWLDYELTVDAEHTMDFSSAFDAPVRRG
jgi:hypothetical protein